MPNMMDYMLWRGDLSVASAPWNQVDTLICATLCYIEFNEYAQDDHSITLHDVAPHLPLTEPSGDTFTDKRRSLTLLMADSVRFSRMQLHHYVNHIDEESQFSAVICDIPDGPVVVAFRGTDATLVGWREDFCLCFENIPAQQYALEYLEKAIDLAGDRQIIVTGHSKGGNLSFYAAAHLDEARQKRLSAVVSFDGPGLDEATMQSDGYRRIKPILSSVIPQDSIVGLLMNYDPDYKVIRSIASGIWQHDSFSWQLHGPAFELLDNTTASSKFMDNTLHNWLQKCSPELRRSFVDYLFDLLGAGDAVTTYDLKADKAKTISNMLAASRDLDPEERKAFLEMLGNLASSGADNAFNALHHFTTGAISGIRERIAKADVPELWNGLKEHLPKLEKRTEVPYHEK